MRYVLLLLLLTRTIPVHAEDPARLLFSHFAPDLGPVTLSIGAADLSDRLAYGETDAAYRMASPGPADLVVIDADGLVLASRTVTLGTGDHSAFFFTHPDGTPDLEVAEDTLAGFQWPEQFDFGTNDGNSSVRFLSFASLPETERLVLLGNATQVFVSSDGSTSQGGSNETVVQLSPGGQPALGGAYPANVNDRLRNAIVVEVGVGETVDGQTTVPDPLVRGEFTLPQGTTDYVVIGTPEALEIIERSRPGAQSYRVDGLYGQVGVIGSGLQLVELRDVGRVYGFLYSYDEDGRPTWYYLDSRCDLDRGFQCTTPGLLVASGSYLFALYQAVGGRLAPASRANLEIVGAGRLRVSRQPSLTFLRDDPYNAVANLSVHLEPPVPGGLPLVGPPAAQFTFTRIER